MKTRKLLAGLLFAAALTGSSSVFAQVKIGDNPGVINPSAVLDLESTNKGFLPPRVALQNLNDGATITTPATGLLVYNTNATLSGGVGIYINTGTPASPSWGKLEANTASTGGSASKLKYNGAIDDSKTVTGGMLEFRYAGSASLQARLLTAPPASTTVTLSGNRFGWFGTGAPTTNGGMQGIANTWNSTNWNQWQQIDGVGGSVSHFYFLGVSADDKFYRISASRLNSQNTLTVETF